MAEEPVANGRRPILSRETLVPWTAAFAFAGLAWYSANALGDIRLEIRDRAASAARDTSEAAHGLQMEVQALKLTVEGQGRDLAQVKESVEALKNGAQKR